MMKIILSCFSEFNVQQQKSSLENTENRSNTGWLVVIYQPKAYMTLHYLTHYTFVTVQNFKIINL